MKKIASVSIPVTTLNALKGLLFNSEEGVDLSDIVEYTFVSYSLIRDIVTYERKVIAKWDSAKNDLCPCSSDGYRDSCSLTAWYDKDTDRSIPTQELVKQWHKEEDKPQQ